MKSFEEAWQEVQGIQYGFTRDEALVLFTLASANREGLCVEIGSMIGGSARLMAATGCHVRAIDPISTHKPSRFADASVNSTRASSRVNPYWMP